MLACKLTWPVFLFFFTPIKMFPSLTGNLDKALKLFTEAVVKNPSASMYAKRARYKFIIYDQVFNS